MSGWGFLPIPGMKRIRDEESSYSDPEVREAIREETRKHSPNRYTGDGTEKQWGPDPDPGAQALLEAMIGRLHEAVKGAESPVPDELDVAILHLATRVLDGLHRRGGGNDEFYTERQSWVWFFLSERIQAEIAGY